MANTKLITVDCNLTAETKSLYKYLQNINENQILFGHQNTTTQGMTINKLDGTQSDCYDTIGDYPAVYGWDFVDGWDFAEHVIKAYDRGGINTFSDHMFNFVTAKDFYDTTEAVAEILPGGSKHQEYKQYLDRTANFFKSLKDKDGKLVPIIYRPFHENNGSWFWWGADFCTVEEYKAIFRFTVEYLRDEKETHNLLYAYSPNGHFDGVEDYIERYPGDDYIDLIGMDSYGFGLKWKEKLMNDLEIIVEIAQNRGKVAALTEVGIADSMKPIGEEKRDNWYMGLLKAIKSNQQARQIKFLLVWRNGAPDHFWVPYGEHEMKADFIKFYQDRITIFNGNLDFERVYKN
jgi:mannan endo-1,4-beta-mannosidase